MAIFESSEEAVAAASACHAAGIRGPAARDTKLGAGSVHLHAHLKLLFFATICFIVYGSLYPWHFYARQLPGNPVWMLLHSWSLHDSDIVVNVLLYAPLGMFGFLSMKGRIGAPIAIGFALSCSMELLQLFDAGRDAGALDVVSNTAGAALGVGCGALFERYRLGGSWLLLICFAVYQVLPHAVNGLWVNSIEWLAVARLIWPRRFRWASQVLAALFAGLIVIRGLAPYHFTSAAAHFSWVPFGVMFQSNRMAALSIVLGKTFVYGTFVWLLRDSGWRMRYAAAAAAATLAAIEVTQMYLPGRTPEITDPLLALILASVLSVI